MKKLEIRLLNYLLLIAMATLMIGIEFFYEINSAQFTDTICGELTMMNEVFYRYKEVSTRTIIMVESANILQVIDRRLR